MDVFIGTIYLFAGNFAPRGFAFCNGAILPIAQNSAVFSILGTTYGGNGTTTFALPDLRSRVPIGVGSGPGLTPRSLGEVLGSESVTLLTSQIPSHSHTVTSTLKVNDGNATITTPVAGNSLALAKDINTDPARIYNNVAPNINLNTGSVVSTATLAGGGQAHENMQPSLGLNYIICLQGLYPSRN